jgi:hypothetical protein
MDETTSTVAWQGIDPGINSETIMSMVHVEGGNVIKVDRLDKSQVYLMVGSYITPVLNIDIEDGLITGVKTVDIE